MIDINIYESQTCKSVSFGRKGENLARRVLFDLSALIAEFGTGEFEWVIRRPYESTAYIAVNKELDGNTAILNLTTTETAISGCGGLELRYYVDDIIVKTIVWRTSIAASLGGGDVPDPIEDYIDQMHEIAQDASESADAAGESATQAATSAANAANSATVSAGYADNSAASASAAADSATDSAESATEAYTSETNAANSATQANDFAVQAANSASAASGSASQAASSVTQAAGSASAAANSATQAAQSATAAANSATAADQSAQDIAAAATQIQTNKDDITELKNQLGVSVGTEVIQFTDNYYINTNAYSAGQTVPLTPVANSSLSYAIVDVTGKKTLVLNARGWTTGRLWAFLTADDVMITKSAQSVVAENLVVKIPENAAKCVLNAFESGRGTCMVGINPRYEIPHLYETIENEFSGKLGVLNDSIFELGNINITDNGWTYQSSNQTVRLKQNIILNCKQGDKIGLTSYNGYRYYIGKLNEDGSHSKVGWLSADYTFQSPGRYVVKIRTEPQEEIADYRTLARLFKGVTVIQYVNDNYLSKDDGLVLDHNYFVKSINHRGYRTESPENTLPAFKLSRQHGFEYVETDIHFTADNIPVLLHDDTINRTAKNADGTDITSTINIANITYEQALQYVFCGNYYGRYPTVRIPTLAEFMTLCRNIGLHPYLELKHGAGTAVQLQQCVEIVKDAGMLNYTSWISFDGDMLRIVKTYEPKSRIGWLVSNPPVTSSNVENLQAMKTSEDDVFIIGGNYTTEEITMCKNAGIPIEAGTTSTAGIPSLPSYIHGVLTEGAIAGKILFEKNIE